MCPGPLIPSTGSLVEGLRVTIDVNPIKFVSKEPSEIGTEVRSRLNEITVHYEDIADIIVKNLEGNTIYKQKRVGAGLPIGVKLEKTGWQLDQPKANSQ